MLSQPTRMLVFAGFLALGLSSAVSADDQITTVNLGVNAVASGHGDATPQLGMAAQFSLKNFRNIDGVLSHLDLSANQDFMTGSREESHLHASYKAGLAADTRNPQYKSGAYFAAGFVQDYTLSGNQAYQGSVNVAGTLEAGLRLKPLADTLILLAPVASVNGGGSTYGTTKSVRAGGQLILIRDSGDHFSAELSSTMLGKDDGGKKSSLKFSYNMKITDKWMANLDTGLEQISGRDAKDSGVILAGQDINDFRLSAGAAYSF